MRLFSQVPLYHFPVDVLAIGVKAGVEIFINRNQLSFGAHRLFLAEDLDSLL